MHRHVIAVALAITHAIAALAAPAAPTAGEPASVKLPLAAYLALVERIEELERARATARATTDPEVAEVVEQTTRVVIGERSAEVTARLEVEVRGRRLAAVDLPVTGAPWSATVSPAATAAVARTAQAMTLAATAPGRYRVELAAVAALEEGAGVQRLKLAPVAAAVAVTEVELPAELAWACPGAVVASDQVSGTRRQLRLALARHQGHTFELRREVRGGAADQVLAKTVVVTLLAVDRLGTSRHDVVLYEVARGALAELAVSLPAGLTVERLASDEGELAAVADGGAIAVQRRALLTGTGFLVISSRAAGDGPVDLAPVEPAVTVRSRYLAVAATTAAELVPGPAERWQRVDLGDLPTAFHEAAARLDLGAAWRWQGEAAPATVAVTREAPAELAATLIEERSTTTLLTVDGTLLHRDRLVVTTAEAALAIQLAPGSTLWSSQVDGVAVRPLERTGATLVPLPFGARRRCEVEVVVVEQQAVPPGRTTVDLALPGVAAPVLTHHWRLLLPEEHLYRYSGGDLVPAPPRAWRVEPARYNVTSATAASATGSGTIRGTVTDTEGLALPAVSVSAASSALAGGERLALTDAEGRYTFSLLPAGHYTLTATMAGFQSVNVELQLGHQQTVRADLSLPFAAFADQVVVVGEAPMVDTGKVASGITFDTDGMNKPRSRTLSRDQVAAAPPPAEARAKRELDELSQGLVGGVRPVPVAIPERGKVLDLAAALPPARVSVQLEVKAGKGR